MAGIMGGHLVGMSTTLEAIAAREAGMEVLGISLVTNLAAGLSGEPLNHEEVLEAGRVRGEPDGRPAEPGRGEDLRPAMRVLVTGAAGSIGRVVTTGPGRLRPRRRRPRPGPAARRHALRLARGRLRRRRRRRGGLRRRAARRRRAPRGHPRRGVAARRAHLPRRDDRRPPRRDGGPRRAAHRLRLLQPRRRPHAPRGRHPDRAGPAPRRHLLRRRQGRGRGAPAPLRRPPRHRRRRVPDRLVPRGARQRARPVDVALPRRLRPDGRGGAEHRPLPATPSSTASAPTPARGGTSSRVAGWATSRRTTPRRTPTGSGPARTTTRRPSSSAARSRRRSSTVPPWALDFEHAPSPTLVR